MVVHHEWAEWGSMLMEGGRKDRGWWERAVLGGESTKREKRESFGYGRGKHHERRTRGEVMEIGWRTPRESKRGQSVVMGRGRVRIRAGAVR